MTTASEFSRFRLSLRSPRGLTAILISLQLMACIGCEDSKVSVAPSSTPATTVASPLAETKADSLADILQRAKAGDIDTAIQRFVSGAPDNWIQSTTLEDLQVSEAAFAKLDRVEKARLQQQVIDRVGEMKGFVRTVVDRANDAKKKGDKETADRYLDAVQRLGRQLRDSDTLTMFQQFGKALAAMKLSE